MKTLVAGPYCGELGWEVFTWQPMVRNIFLSNDYDQCIIYTGKGKELLYPFAAEVRTLPNVPKHEAECLAWHNFHKYKEEFVELIKQMAETVQKEFPEGLQIYTFSALEHLNYEYFDRGYPDLLTGNKNKKEFAKQFNLKYSEKPVLTFNVRDREMSDHRNWNYIEWGKLCECLSDRFDINLVGLIRDKESWENVIPENVNDLTSKTTINDCINLFQHTDLTIGGSTGMTHLAARCNSPHLVWGNEKVLLRCAQTNWFGTPYKVYLWGWEPKPEQIAEKVNNYFDNGEFK